MPMLKIQPRGIQRQNQEFCIEIFLQPIRQIETSEVEDPRVSPLQSQENLDDSNLKDISKQESDDKSKLSAPRGPVTRSKVAGGEKLLSNCVPGSQRCSNNPWVN